MLFVIGWGLVIGGFLFGYWLKGRLMLLNYPRKGDVYEEVWKK